MATIIERLEEASVTDTFLRDESPLGSPWVKPSWVNSICLTDDTNGWDAQTVYNFGRDGARYTGSTPKTDEYAFAFATLSLSSNQIADRWNGIWAFMSTTGARSGYRGQMAMTASETYDIVLHKAEEAQYTTLASVSGITASTSGSTTVGTLAIVVGDGKVFLFFKPPGGEFSEVLSAEDSTFTEGHSGIETQGNFAYLTNFSTGEFTLVESEPPVATTGEATGVTGDSATLAGSVNPKGTPTNYYFEYVHSEPALLSAGGFAKVACDDTFVYYDASGHIGRAKLDGTEVEPEWLNVVAAIRGLAVDEEFIYWTDANTNFIGRAKIDGSEPDTEFIAAGGTLFSITVTDKYIYWGVSEPSAIGRANLDGTEPDSEWLGVTASTGGLTNDDTYVYWVNSSSSIGRVGHDGTEMDGEFISGLPSSPNGLTIRGGDLLWGEPFADSVGTARVDGTGVLGEWLPISAPNCRDVASNGSEVFWGTFSGGGATEIGQVIFETTPEESAGEGSEPVGVEEEVTELQKVTYVFRLLATSAGGESVGSWGEFTPTEATVVNVKLPGGEVVAAKRWIKLPNGELLNA